MREILLREKSTQLEEVRLKAMEEEKAAEKDKEIKEHLFSFQTMTTILLQPITTLSHHQTILYQTSLCGYIFGSWTRYREASSMSC